MGHKEKLLALLLTAVLLVGCASIQAGEPTGRQKAYQRSEIRPLVRHYIRKYGEPMAEMQAWSYAEDLEYVVLFWIVDGIGHRVALEKNYVENPNGWFIDIDTFELYYGSKCKQDQ